MKRSVFARAALTSIGILVAQTAALGATRQFTLSTDTSWRVITPDGDYQEGLPIDFTDPYWELMNPEWNLSLDYDDVGLGWSNAIEVTPFLPTSGTAIWAQGTGTPAYFRKTFTIDGNPTAASLSLSVDDDAIVYVNGQEVLYDNDGVITQQTIDIGSALRSGENLIAVKAHDSFGFDQTLEVNLSGSYAPSQKIFLDWDIAISSDFRIERDVSTGVETVRDYPFGAEPLLTHPDAFLFAEFKQDVISRVREIFNASGLDAIDIVDEPPTGDALIVRFSPDVLQYDHDGNALTPDKELLGRAFDVGPDDFKVIDRFNRRMGGEVAVFVDLSTHSPEFVAENIAHEVGHGLGLRHVNPPGALAVMDYQHAAGDIEQFTNGLFEITEPPTDDGTRIGLTHNPLYHLRRYVLGESQEALVAEDVLQGGWDDEAVTPMPLQDIAWNKLETDAVLYDVFVEANIGDEQWVPLRFFPTLSSRDFAGVVFQVGVDLPFRIVASSSAGSDEKDLFVGTGNASAPELIFQNLPPAAFEAMLFSYSRATGDFSVVGVIEGAVTSIPEPGSYALAVIGMIIAVAVRTAKLQPNGATIL